MLVIFDASASRLCPKADFGGQETMAGSLRFMLACQPKLRSSEGWLSRTVTIRGPPVIGRVLCL
jgi:hypothetical protein